jgi:tripartite-type tricarboxylate transporter receptor subunit TctC
MFNNLSGGITVKKSAILMLVMAVGLTVAACSQKPTEESKPALDYPKRAIEIVVPFGPGGSADIMTRQVANLMGNYVDKPVNVVNKAGGGGVDGMVYVAQAPADGYTILQITPSHAIAEALSRPNANLSGDFEPIANFQKDIQVFGVAKDSPINTLEDLIAYAKANPGKLKIGGTSPGGLDDYMANGFAEAAGIELTYVPYNSASETKAAALGGEIDIYQDKVISFLTMVQSGEIKPIVVLHDVKLSMIPELKDTPCTVEKNIDFTQGSWRGFAVKKGTPQEVKDYLTEVIEKVYNSTEYVDASKKDMSNIIPGYIGQKEYGEMWVKEIAKFKAILAK